MTVISFLHDLGIIPNEGTGLEKNENLLQGQKYMEYGRVYAKSVHPHLARLQTTSSPELESIVEGLNTLLPQGSINGMSINGMSINGMSINGMSVNGMSVNGMSVNGMSVNGMSVNETEFNKTLNEYSLTYKTLNEDILQKKQYNEVKNKGVMEKLGKLNKKLIMLAEKISNELNHLPASPLNKSISNKQAQLKSYIKQLSTSNSGDKYSTLLGMEESSRLNATSTHFFYLFWLILAVIITLLLITGMSSTTASTSMTILFTLFICFILILYISK
jgi:hypothetical protein